MANSRPALFTPLLGTFLPADLISGEKGGIFVATAVFMIAILIALAVSYALTAICPLMPVVHRNCRCRIRRRHAVSSTTRRSSSSAYHHLCLVRRRAAGRGCCSTSPFLQLVFDSMFKLTAEGWRKLTLRWAVFFLALAVLNELVWRTQTTDTWVNFKVSA